MKILHCSAEYDLRHLASTVLPMGHWIGQIKQEIRVEIEIKYTCHCYTVSSATQPLAGIWNVQEKNEWRVFDVSRHSLSMHLPKIVETLIRQPNKQIQKVSGRHNFKIFQMGLTGLIPDEKYYVFFKIDRTNRVGMPGFHQIRLSVESAYPKRNIVSGDWRPPFGKAVEEILGLR